MEPPIFSLKRTSWKRTWGIVNLPLAFGPNNEPIYTNKNGKVKQATDSSLRYLFFELDSLNKTELEKVLKVYFLANIPVYYHRTMRGWHFLSVKPISKELHANLIFQIKELNKDCPHVTIRIKPNKWVNEAETFREGYVQNGCYEDKDIWYRNTLELALWLKRQHIGLIRKHYKVVNYPFGDDKIA